MYKKILFLILYIFSCSLSWKGISADEIRVELGTECELTPVYLGRFTSNETSFSKYYAGELRKVLEFDLGHNGISYILPTIEEKEKLLHLTSKHMAFQPEVWKSSSAAQVVCGHITDKKLSITVYSPKKQTVKTFQDIMLTGTLAQDRKLIHKIADMIQKTAFDMEGIANQKILFAKQKTKNGDWSSEIWECDWDGQNKRQITREDSYGVTPVVVPPHNNPTSDKFLYVSYKFGQPKIYLASFQKGEGKRLVDLRGNQLLPAISPKKDKIAFICDATGRADLFVQGFDPYKGAVGKPVQLFSYPRSVQASPSFSPDGEKIAFVSDKDGSPRIYTIPSKAGSKRADPVLITKVNRESSCPSWSPDGKKLAYSAKTNGVRQIWIYDFETQTESQLTSGPGNKENPVWASNSLHLVFNSVEGAVSDLYVVNLHQAEPIKITNDEGKNHYPSWATK